PGRPVRAAQASLRRWHGRGLHRAAGERRTAAPGRGEAHAPLSVERRGARATLPRRGSARGANAPPEPGANLRRRYDPGPPLAGDGAGEGGLAVRPARALAAER